MTALPTSRSSAGAREWAALAVLMLPVLLVSVDSTALSFALPAISRELQPSGAQLLWIVDVYPLVLAGLLVPMGTLGDRIGRRRLLLAGGTGFAAVSVASAFASSAELLLAGRAAMGLFGAVLMPATLSLLRNIFRDPARRRIAVAVWAGSFSAGAALGPVVGGLLLNHFWWGSVFLLSVPVLVPLLVLGPLLVPESRDPRPGPVDVLSVLLAMLAMTPVVYGLKEATASGDHAEGLLSAALGVVAGILFVRRQAVLRHPVLDLGLFRVRAFSGGVAVNVLGNVGLYGFLFMLAQYLQLVVGLDPMSAGLTMVPGLALTVLAGFLAVRAVRRFAARTVITAGMLVSAAGFLVVAVVDLSADVGAVAVPVAFCLVGAGIGLAETLSNDLVLSAAPPHRAGAAAAISETGYEVGAVLGTAALGGLLTASYQRHLDLPGALGGAPTQTAHETLGGAVEVAETAGVLGPSVRDAAFEAFTAGMQWTALVMTVVVGLSALVVARVLRSAPPRPVRRRDPRREVPRREVPRRGIPRRRTRTYAGPAEGRPCPPGTEGVVAMTPQEMFEDAARRPSQVAGQVLAGISPEVLHARPGGRANSVAWLVWHAARQQDAQVADLAGADEVWTSEGWNERFGLDVPDSATGFGQTAEDAARIRVASPELLRGYLDAVVERVVAHVHGLTDAQLDDVVDRSWTPHVTRGVRLLSTVDDAAQHLGQAAYVRGLLDGGWSGPS